MAVKQEFTVDDRDLDRAYAKLEQQNTKLLEQNRRLAESARRHTNSHKGAAAAMVASFVAVGVQVLSVNKAIQLLIQSNADLEAQQKKARDLTISQADSQRDALINLGPVSQKVREKFLSDMKKLAEDTKVPLAQLYSAASAGLSASGGNLQATLGAVGTAAKVSPHSAEQLQAVANALLHMSKATKTEDPMKNLGFLLGVGQQAAVTDPGKIASNLSAGVIGVTGYGGTAQEAGAIVAALTQGMADPEGQTSSTAAINLAKKLDEFFPTEDTYKWETDKKTGAVEKVLDRKGTGLQSPTEKILYLREHEDERRRFLSEASFEAKAQIPVEQLLGETVRGQTTRKYHEQALQAIPKAEDAAGMATELLKGIEGVFEQKMAGMGRTETTAVEEMQTSIMGKERALAGMFSTASLDETLAAAGVGYAERSMATMSLRVGGRMPWAGSQEKTYAAITQQHIDALKFGSSPVDQSMATYSRLAGREKISHLTDDPGRLQMGMMLERLLSDQMAKAAELRDEIKGLRADAQARHVDSKSQPGGNGEPASAPVARPAVGASLAAAQIDAHGE